MESKELHVEETPAIRLLEMRLPARPSRLPSQTRSGLFLGRLARTNTTFANTWRLNNMYVIALLLHFHLVL